MYHPDVFYCAERSVEKQLLRMHMEQSSTQADHAGLLLQQFAEDLQEWDARVAAGLAAVTTLQRSFGELEAAQPPPQESSDVHRRLLELAPSFRLEQYIQQQHKPAATASDAASSIHTAINSLRATVQSQHTLLLVLTDACTRYQDCILSQQLACTGIHTSVLQPAREEPPAPRDTLIGPANQQGQKDGSTTSSSSSSTALDAETDAAAAAAEPAQHLQPEEAALLMGAVMSGLQQDLQWMEAAIGGISLEISTEELSTLRTLWELQPFTNEAALHSISAAAASSADS